MTDTLHLGKFARRDSSVNDVTTACMVTRFTLVTKAISVCVVFVAARMHQKYFTLRTYLSCCSLLLYQVPARIMYAFLLSPKHDNAHPS